jgi:tRNA A37 threonylcarbamoyladenosine synthetase subunit TsaC/SUA5/YrdC
MWILVAGDAGIAAPSANRFGQVSPTTASVRVKKLVVN